MEDDLKSPNWHFNFRDKKRLADIAVLQKEYYATCLAIGLAACMVFAYFFGIYQSMQKNSTLDKLEETIASRTPDNQNYLESSASFKAHIVSSQNLQAFYTPSLSPVEFMSLLAQKAPTALIFKDVNFQEQERITASKLNRYYSVTMSGFIEGEDDDAITQLNDFEASLMRESFFQENMDEFEVVKVTRDHQLDLIHFQISMRLVGT